MKKFTLLEFQNYCYEQGFKEYSFITDTQKWDSVFNPLRINIRCEKVSVCLHPNMICFSHGGRCLFHLNSVKYIKLLEDRGGKTFEIVCGDSRTNDRDISYNIVAA